MYVEIYIHKFFIPWIVPW